ncbi:MAG: pentapeptide repeat-containing protein [Pararobbsia sp.]
MKIEIKHRWSLAVLFSHDVENNTMKLTLEAAVRAGSNLRGSNLRGSNLRGSDLRDSDLSDSDLSDSDLSGSNLRGSDLSDSDLSGSDLRGSNLRGSNLRGSNLRGSNLRGSDLRDSDLSDSDLSDSDLSGSNLRGSDLSDSDLSDSDLSGSDLRGSDLRGSNLRGSNLRGSDLRDSDLSDSDLRGSNLLPIKADFIEVISQAPREVPALIEALKDGRVDGSTYTGVWLMSCGHDRACSGRRCRFACVHDSKGLGPAGGAFLHGDSQGRYARNECRIGNGVAVGRGLVCDGQCGVRRSRGAWRCVKTQSSDRVCRYRSPLRRAIARPRRIRIMGPRRLCGRCAKQRAC